MDEQGINGDIVTALNRFFEVMHAWETDNGEINSMMERGETIDAVVRRQGDRLHTIFDEFCIYGAHPARWPSLSLMHEYLPGIERVLEMVYWSDRAVTVKTETELGEGKVMYLYDLTLANGKWLILDNRRRFNVDGSLFPRPL